MNESKEEMKTEQRTRNACMLPRCCSDKTECCAFSCTHSVQTEHSLTHTHTHTHGDSNSPEWAPSERWRQLLLLRWESNRICCVIDCDLCGPNIHCTESRWKSQSEHISSKRLRAKWTTVQFTALTVDRSFSRQLRRHNRVGVFRDASFNTLETHSKQNQNRYIYSKHVRVRSSTTMRVFATFCQRAISFTARYSKHRTINAPKQKYIINSTIGELLEEAETPNEDETLRFSSVAPDAQCANLSFPLRGTRHTADGSALHFFCVCVWRATVDGEDARIRKKRKT